VLLVDATGRPVRHVTHAELLDSLATRAGVEGARIVNRLPLFVTCLDCGAPAPVRYAIPKRCPPCRAEHRAAL